MIGSLARAWHVPLWVHISMLAVVLTASVLLVGDDGVFSSDEGVGISQAKVVSEGHWGLDHPFPDVPAMADWFPFQNAVAASNGGYAPLPKKPVYSWIGAQAFALGGSTGLMLLSASGTLIAGVLTALITRELSPGLDRAALWMAGLVSPLFLDGLIVIGHTLAAAAAAAAALGALRWARGGRLGWLVLVVGGPTMAVLMRAEALLLSLAMTVSALAIAMLYRRVRVAISAIGLGGGAVAGFLLDRSLTHALFGYSSVNNPADSTSAAGASSYLAGRVSGFVMTWLRPGYDVVRGPQLLGILLVLVAASCVILTRRGHPPAVLQVLCGVVGGLAIGRLAWRASPADVVPGLLVAFPIMLGGLLGLRRRVLAQADAAWCGLSFGMFSLAVIATQYRQGGGWEWGGRYFAAGLPLLVPLVVIGGREVLRHLDARTRWMALSAVVVVGVCTATLQLLAVRDSHSESDRLVGDLWDVASSTEPGDGGTFVIISTEPEMTRMAWRAMGRARWLHVPVEQVPEALRVLRGQRVSGLTVATLSGPRLAEELSPLPIHLPDQPPSKDIWWFVPLRVG